MSPTRKARRPAPRAGKSSRAKLDRATRGSRTNTTWYALTAVIVVVGVTLVVLFRSPNSASGGIQIGDHWHAALGVYACDHWDGGATWPTPQNPVPNMGMHSHGDGLMHLEPQTSEFVGKNGKLGNFFRVNGLQLSSTSVAFDTADLKNGDTCAKAPGKLHWLVNGKERVGNPAEYVVRNRDWIVIAFLPESKKITTLGKPPSYPNLAKQ